MPVLEEHASNDPVDPSNRPLLVTGAHRTGTTWVGKMLAAGGQATYISEPLNVWHRAGVFRPAIRHWYTYVTFENEADYLPAFRQLLAYRYHPLAEVVSLRSGKDVLRMGRDWSAFITGRIYRRRPLLKDPFACFSIPWFIQRLGCQVVVTVRHPAAFASSLKRLGWCFDFNDLLAQPLLMRDWLEPFREEMELTATTDSKDIIAQSSLLWRIIYRTVETQRRQFPHIQVVRHEDLSLDPVAGYQTLYAALGLVFSPRAQQAILNSSSSGNPREVSKKRVHAYRLDSRLNLHNWKRRLTPEEIERVRCMTGEMAAQYYPEIDWG